MKVIHNKLKAYVTESGYINFSAHYNRVEGAESGSNWLLPSDNTEHDLIALYVTSGSEDDMHELDIASIETGYSASAKL